MPLFRVLLPLLLCLTLAFFFSCKNKSTGLVWTQSLFQIGSQSSPRTVDLNSDGILDVVMGAGKEEMASCDHGVIAINGLDGSLLWKAAAKAHVVGSATFLDINEDGTDDVVIGGRGHFLTALDGTSGVPFWQYEYEDTTDANLQYARFNFYNSVLIPDQSGDQLEEILIVNGGNWDAAPGVAADRYPGVLMIIDPLDGRVVAADTMPDGKESYMSPVVFQRPAEAEVMIIFGSGGETIGGNLYQSTIAALVEDRLEEAQIIATEFGHGFIAPPAIADVTEDGIPDVIVISHASTIHIIDGRTYGTVWTKSFAGFETSSSVTLGKFDHDKIPDCLLTMSRGIWPNYSISRQVILNGKDGSVIFQDSLGCFSLACPVIYDLDKDGLDEAIISLNQYDCVFTLSEDTLSPPDMQTRLLAVNFDQHSVQEIVRKDRFRNIFSTPWIGDMDQDGYLDIIYSEYFNANDIRRYMGMSVHRISTSIRMKDSPRWGGYMGSSGTGIY